MSKRRSIVMLAASQLAVVACLVSAGSSALAARPVVRIAYFVPADREPIPGYVERLDLVMSNVQDFYRMGMQANGYGPMTFELDRGAGGALNVHVVRGAKPLSGYSRDPGPVVAEVNAQLARDGIDTGHETVVIFGVMLDWRGRKTYEVGPYCGGGGLTNGACNVYDDALLDPRLLGSQRPGGYYGQPCSIGEFNSHYIGGVAHELGHAFGLPHECETQASRPDGISLMGGGNHTYGRTLRGEQPGTVLAPAGAMLLARHPLFLGTKEGLNQDHTCSLMDPTVSFKAGTLYLAGRVVAIPEVFGIGAYNDDMDVPGDYDAVGWTCPVTKDGDFRLAVGEIGKPGKYQLRLLAVHSNGARSTFTYDYSVDDGGVPDTDSIEHSFLLSGVARLLVAGDTDGVKTEAARLAAAYPGDRFAQELAASVLRLMQPPGLRSPADIPDAETSVWVSDLEFQKEGVGWGEPARDRFDSHNAPTYFLSLGPATYDRGMYAHAPSHIEVATAGKWTVFQSGFGLRNGGDGGSIVAVVRGDGRELFRSPVIRDHDRHDVRVNIAGVQVLELVMEDGGDGNRCDWAIWVEPQLTR